MITLFFQSLIQGAGWTFGCVASLCLAMCWEDLRDYIVDKVIKRHDLR